MNMLNNTIRKCLNRGDKRGYSMVELMVTMFIFTILAAGLMAISLVSESSWATNKVKIELQQELRKAMESLVFELREAGPSSITNVPADGAWYTSINFKVPSATGVVSGSIDWEALAIQYLLSSNQLQRVFNSQTKIVATNIQSLQFRRQAASPQILEVALQAQKTTTKGMAMSHNLTFDIQLRN